MKTLVYAVTICVALFYSLAPAEAAQEVYCRSDPGPSKIKVTVGNGTLTYNHRVSSAQLQKLASNAGVLSSAGARAMGLTTAITGTKYKIKTRLVPASNGGWCVYFSDVRAFVGITKLKVYIDRQYRRGTCQYNQILKHEGQHVAIYRRYAQDAGMWFREELPRAMDRISPMLAANKREAGEILNLLQQEMAPLLEHSKQGQRRENAALDTPQSYRRFNARCPSW